MRYGSRAPSRGTQIIKARYGAQLRSPPRRRGLLDHLLRRKQIQNSNRQHSLVLYQKRERLLTRARILMICGIMVFFGMIILSIIYYNRLTRLEQDVFKEMAKIDTLLQRRRNISINLARTVRDYALHEQQVLNHVSNTRANPHAARKSEKAKPTPENSANDWWIPKEAKRLLDEALAMLARAKLPELPIDNSLAKFLAVAEQYPDLKLSKNFRRFMDALIETEKDLSDQRIRCVEVVNDYTTQVRTFPGRLFAMAYGFEAVSYFEADKGAKQFRPVSY